MSNDRIKISSLDPSLAKDVDRFAGLVAKSRTERIAQLRVMLDAGTYNVSSFDLARKLIETYKR